MADLDSLYNALRNADAAGDTEGAKRLAQYIQQTQAAAPVETPKKSTIGSELKRGAQQVASSMQTAYGALTGSPEEAARKGLERGEAISQVAGEGVGLEPVKRAYQDKGLLSAAGEAVSQIPRALAGQGANFATMAGGARLGAMAGSAIAPGPGTLIGGALGAGAALLPQLFGSNVESQAAAQMERGEPVKIDRTKAGVAAAGQAALEGAGTAFTLGKGVVKGILGIVDDAAITSAKTAQQLQATAQRSLAASAGRGAARGAVVEMPVEVAQQVIERAQAGQDLTSPEAFTSYGEAAYQAGLVGGPLGAAGNVVNRGQAQTKVAAQAEADAATARANAPQPGPQLPPEAPAGTQGALFTPEEMGPEVKAPAAPPPPKEETKAPEGQQDLGLDFARTAADATLERERLKQQPQTPEVKARIKELDEQLLLSTQSEVEAIRADKERQTTAAEQEAKARKKFPGLANAPDLMNASDEVKSRTQGELFPAEDLGGEFAGPQTAARPPAALTEEGKAPYQYKLPLRTVLEGRNPNRNLTIPARPGELTSKDIADTGVTIGSGVRTWADTNVVGKTKPEVQALVDKDPTLVEGKTQRAKLLRELLAQQPAKFEEPTNVQPTPAAPPAVEPRNEPRASEPSVGVPSQPAAPIVSEPTAGVPGATGAPAAPVGRRLVPTGQPASEGNAPQTVQPPAVTNAPKTPPPAPVSKPAPAATTPKAPKASPAPAPTKAVTEDENVPELPTPPSVQRLLDSKTRAQYEVALDDLVRIQRSEVHPDKDAVGEFLGSNVRHEVFEKALQAAEERVRRSTPEPKVEAKPEPKVEAKPESKVETKLEPKVKAKPAPVAKSKPEPKVEAKQKFNPEKPQLELAKPVKTPEPSAIEMTKAIDGRPMIEAAQWAAKNLPDPDQKVIAQRVIVKLRQLQELGADLKPIRVTPEGRRLIGLLGIAQLDQNIKGGVKTGPTTIKVTLNHPSNGEASGVTPEILLHELVHAATMGAIELGRYKSAAGSKVGDATRELMDLTDAVIAHFNKRVRDKETLTPFETKILNQNNNALQNFHEVLAWGLTNRDMQEYMESIPYKGQTAWNKFVTYIRDLLGIPAKADTALSEVLRVADTLFNLTKEDIRGAETQTGKQFSVSVGTESLINSMGPLDADTKSGWGRLIDGVKANPDIDYVTKFRTQIADIAATIEQRLRTKFDGAVRDNLGNINPMGLYRQAQDYSKMLLEYFQTGTLYKDPATGQWKSGLGKGVRPPAEVYALIDKYAEKNGYTRERATQIASRVLEGVRLDGMRKSNYTGATKFILHLKDNEIDQLVREYNADPDLQEISKLMDEARIAMVDNLVKVGRLTKEVGDEWKSVVGYVPFDRIEDFATKYSSAKKISTRGISQLGKLPELIGSDVRPVGNVFDNYINTLGWMVGQTLKTDATITTLRSLEGLGFAKKIGNTTQGHANTVESYIDGEKIYWSVPSKYDVMAFKDLNPPKAGWIRAMGEFSNVLRKAVTVLPPFALKQVTDDVQRAILTSGVKNPGALMRMSLTNFGGMAWAELRGIQHPVVKEFGALGLSGEYDFQHGKPASSLLKELGYKERGVVGTLMHRLDGITRASDLAVRKAIYDQTLIETNDELLAQTRSREFINFRRRGASETINTLVTTIPFFNAYIQGMDVLYRAASGKDSSSSVDRAQARRLFWSRGATVFMLSSLYALGKGDDDEDYNEMDLRTRDNNWIIGGGYKIGVPGELGALFKVIPERIVEYMRRQGTPEEQTAFEAMRTTLSYMFEQYLGRVVPVPQAIKPVMEAWANKSFLTGRALEGYHHQAMDPSARVTEQTSELAKAIANFSRDEIKVEVSPIMIDNALRGYFGSSAAIFTMVTDSLLNPTRVDRPLHKYALLSNYLYDPVGTRRMTEFYDEREKVGKANTTLNELMKTDLDRAEKYATEHQDELALESAINSTLNQLENTRAYRKFLNSPEGAKDMSVEERDASLKEIKSMETEYVKWVREAQTELRNAQR